MTNKDIREKFAEVFKFRHWTPGRRTPEEQEELNRVSPNKENIERLARELVFEAYEEAAKVVEGLNSGNGDYDPHDAALDLAAERIRALKEKL